MALTCSIPIEMCHTYVYIIDDFDQTYTSMEVEIDPADYPGLVAARFEAIAYNSSDIPQPVQLIDSSGTLYATVNILDTKPVGGSDFARYETPFTLNPVKTKYWIKFPRVEEWGTGTNILTIRIWLDVVASDRIRVQYILAEGQQSYPGGMAYSEENDLWAFYVSALDWQDRPDHTSYAYSGWDGDIMEGWNLFLKEESKWSQVDHWTFEVTGCVLTSNDVHPGTYPEDWYESYGWDECVLSVALFNHTTGLMVAGTELVFTEFAPTRKTVDFANDAANFTDGDEFELRFKSPYTGEGGYARYSCVGPIYRTALYVTLDPAVKAQIYMKVGVALDGLYLGDWYDEETRLRYDESLWPADVIFYIESSILRSPYETLISRERSEEIVLTDGHRYTLHSTRDGVTGHVCLTDNYDADWGGAGGLLAYGDTATVISNGALDDPLNQVWPAYEGWRDPNGVLANEGITAEIQLNAANDTAIIEVSGYDFSSIPPAATVMNVGAQSVHGCIGPPYWVDTYVPSLGSGLPIDAFVDAVSYVGGAMQGTWHAGNCPNWFLLNPAWEHFDLYYPQNTWPQPSPITINFSGGASYVFDADRAWTWADIQSGSLAIRFRVRVPNVKRFLQFFVCWTAAYVVAGSEDTVCMDFGLTINARTGTTFIIAEVEGPAVCVSVTPAIDSATVLVTGTGVGLNATLWRVIRVSDSTVMDSGSGNDASISFIGAYDTVYQLQFMDGGVWSTEGCTFSFAGNIVVPCNDLPCSVPKCIPTGTLVEYSGTFNSSSGFAAKVKQIGPMA